MKKVKNIRLKQCPSCKEGVCKTCHGTGTLRIINSRSKGHTFERDIAKRFSTWVGFACKRSPASGGILKTGDIIPSVPEDMVSMPFCIELKKREGWNLTELIKGTDVESGIMSWWQQVIGDSAISKKIPLLIFSKNNEDSYLMMWTSDFEKLIPLKDVNKLVFNTRTIFLLSDLLKANYLEVKSLLTA